jgi:hypothetical protein
MPRRTFLRRTREGVLQPAEDCATALFNTMLVQGSANEVKLQLLRLKQRGSILDALNAEERTEDGGINPPSVWSSTDEGNKWPDTRLVAKDGITHADTKGYLAITRTRDGRFQLVTSRNHDVFNLAWVKSLTPEPKK